MAERHFLQHIAFGKNAGHPILTIDHRDRSHMVVEHFMNSIGHGCFQPHGCNFPVTKLQHAHKSPPSIPNSRNPNSTASNWIDALCSRRNTCQANLPKNFARQRSEGRPPSHRPTFENTFPSFMTKWTLSSALMSR